MMKRWAIVVLALFVLLTGVLAPSDAYAWHGGWWGPGLFLGGLALGAALTYPYYAYPYPAYPYPAYPYAYPPTVIYQQAPAPSPPLVQRDVCYEHGCYHLNGDGVTQPWQWVWMPTAPPVPPPPPPQR